MLNKRKTHKFDPNRINNYNKFLSTLDQRPILLNTDNIDTNNTDNKTDDEVKQKIDKLIETIEKKYEFKNYSSHRFTGENLNDNVTLLFDDPNVYKDFMKKKYTFTNEIKDTPAKKIDENSETRKPKTIINIETEINNIKDILKLIETYKIDCTVKYNINMKALHAIKEPLIELDNMIGMKSLKSNIVDQILYFIQELHKNNNSSGDFMHTVIYGPPGTGKTEIAKIIGKIYSKIGILNKGTFKKVTRSDLIAGYLGQTALKTQDVVKDALGGVLFIDEAYALGNPEKRDSFSKECIDTLCEALSDNKDNLMVIIAGYENELKECFFNYNQGLHSRFSWRFKTDEYTGDDLYNIFLKKVNEIGWSIHQNSNITSCWFTKNKDWFKFYGRDIETVLAKTKIAHSRRVFCKPNDEKKKITLNDLEKGFEVFLNNDDVKSRKEAENLKKQIYTSLYC
jgi:SpoVK/Ycf46/Vps4 family AAA+-type ATPase